MEHESADPKAPLWSDPKYPTEEEIAALPDYVHPATRWSLAFISFIAGCVAAGMAVLQLAGDQVIPSLVQPDPAAAGGHTAAWVGLISGLCWMAAGVTIFLGRFVATGVWFLLGLITGVAVTFL